MGQEPEESQFKVSDRRRFSAEGEPLDSSDETEAAESSPSNPAPEATQTEVKQGSPPVGEPSAAGQPEMPPIPEASFELLVVSLAMQAQMELGVQGGPQAPVPNLDLARHSIDLLGVLQEKTKGNLTIEESRLVENTLTELRFRYVQRLEEINKRAKT